MILALGHQRRSVGAETRHGTGTAVPKLSARADRAATKLGDAGDEAARAAVWPAMTADVGVVKKVAHGRKLAHRRLVTDAVRAVASRPG